MKNDGEYPLPSKSTGEGGVAKPNVGGATIGRNAQGTSGLGEVKQGIHSSGVGGHGSKEHNSVPKNQSGAK